MSANKKYKDSVFRLLFNEKRKLIELYNAIEGTNYTEDTDLELTTLEDFLKSHGSEVLNMLFTEFNLEEAKEIWQEEVKQEIALSLFGVLDDKIIAEKTGLSLDEILRLKNEN